MQPILNTRTARLIGIGELATLSGLSVRALRFYEEKGLISARRDRYNVRRYDDTARRRVLLLAQLRRGGLSLRDAGRIIKADPCETTLAKLVRDVVDARLRQLDAERQTLQQLADGQKAA